MLPSATRRTACLPGEVGLFPEPQPRSPGKTLGRPARRKPLGHGQGHTDTRGTTEGGCAGSRGRRQSLGAPACPHLESCFQGQPPHPQRQSGRERGPGRAVTWLKALGGRRGFQIGEGRGGEREREAETRAWLGRADRAMGTGSRRATGASLASGRRPAVGGAAPRGPPSPLPPRAQSWGAGGRRNTDGH